VDRPDRPLIICYDGTPPAVDAVAAAAALLPGARAIVVTAWKPILDTILAVVPGPAPPLTDLGDVDERQRRAAEDISSDGAKRAREAGLDAEPLALRTEDAIWQGIAELAESRDARLIVCGASRAGLRSALLDTIPTALIHRASRPVLVVPSSGASTERRRELTEAGERTTQARR
jgi:nucleotide-binding universal stress UspA family protein